MILYTPRPTWASRLRRLLGLTPDSFSFEAVAGSEWITFSACIDNRPCAIWSIWAADLNNSERDALTAQVMWTR